MPPAEHACKRCWWRNNLQWAVMLGVMTLVFGGENETTLRTSLVFVLAVGMPWFVLKQIHPTHGS